MKPFFNPFTYPYVFFIPIQACSSLNKPPDSIDCLASTKSLKSIDSDPVFCRTVTPVPEHILAQYGIFSNPLTHEVNLADSKLTRNPFGERATEFVCGTTVDSPLEPDVQVLVKYLKEERWNWYCMQITDRMPYCTQLVSHRTAAIGICGPYQHQKMCQDVASDVASLCTLCTRHINDDDRVGGIAITAGRPGSMTPLFRGLIAYHNTKLG